MTKEKLVCRSHFADKDLIERLARELRDEKGLKDLAKLYKAMGDPTRLRIIYILSKSPLCVCDIALLLDMTQSSISHHLRVLRDINLVKFKREGKLVIYDLDDHHVLNMLDQGLEHIAHQ